MRIDHVVDLAEIPTVQERQVVDTDSDGHVSDAESSSYAPSACAEQAEGLELRIDGKRLDVSVAGAAVTFPPGVGGLDALRLESALDAVPARRWTGGAHRLVYIDSVRTSASAGGRSP